MPPIDSSALRMKSFPPGRRGVLLPVDDRAAAAQGICLYTVSRPSMLRLQTLAFTLTRLLGTVAIPGRAHAWEPPLNVELWRDLMAQWADAAGTFDRFAVYQRRQEYRDGMTLLLTNKGQPVAIIKIRQDPAALLVEQRALSSALASRPATFSVPAPLGSATIDDELAWSAQRAVFTLPHRPVVVAPPQLFEDVRAALPWVPCAAGQQPAHHDLTPWNLRRDRNGTIWLFDWEDVTAAPLDADRTYFHATAHALTDSPMPDDLSPSAVEHWKAALQARTNVGADADLAAGILRGLNAAAGEPGHVL